MAGAGLLALLDDIATVLDDVALMTKVAARKTAGVLGDDLALNAQQVSGVRAERELPVVWAVAKGSAKNKCILVPAALLISAVAPWLITPLLMLGGAFLCYEGVEKIAHHFAGHHSERQRQTINALENPTIDIAKFEAEKIRGAITTDFVLSAEIIVIALGTVQHAPLLKQLGVVVTIAVLMTIGVYGLVAAIVKLDDAGLYLCAEKAEHHWAKFKRAVGYGILRCCPYLLKTLTVVGTAAMFLVGGSILAHGIPPAHQLIASTQLWLSAMPVGSGFLAVLTAPLINAVLGIVVGAGLVLAGHLYQQLRQRFS